MEFLLITWFLVACMCRSVNAVIPIVTPVMAGIKFKTLPLAYQAVNGSAPAYIQKLIRPHTPARPLLSVTSGHLALSPITPALLVHNCYLFWPHDGGMTFLWMSEQQRRWPPSNTDWKLISSDCISPSLPHPHKWVIKHVNWQVIALMYVCM